MHRWIPDGQKIFREGSFLRESALCIHGSDTSQQTHRYDTDSSRGRFLFTTFHDAAEPLGFLFKSRADGDVLAFATDTVNLAYRFPGVNILAIEANYDQEILARSERIPEKTRHRITNSHMEIGTLCRYLRGLDLTECREVYLLHLSDAMSHEGQFINRVRRCVPTGVRVAACPK